MLPYSKSKSLMKVLLGSFPGFLARMKGRDRSFAMEPAKMNPLLSMLAIEVASNDLEISVNLLQVLINASGVSIRLVISLKVIPSIGKSSTVQYSFY